MKTNIYIKHSSKIFVIFILIISLFSFNVSCKMLDDFFFSDLIHGFWRDTDQTEHNQQTEDKKKEEVQRPGERVSPEQEADKNINLETDKGLGATSEGAADTGSGGGYGGHP